MKYKDGTEITLNLENETFLDNYIPLEQTMEVFSIIAKNELNITIKHGKFEDITDIEDENKLNEDINKLIEMLYKTTEQEQQKLLGCTDKEFKIYKIAKECDIEIFSIKKGILVKTAEVSDYTMYGEYQDSENNIYKEDENGNLLIILAYELCISHGDDMRKFYKKLNCDTWITGTGGLSEYDIFVI